MAKEKKSFGTIIDHPRNFNFEKEQGIANKPTDRNKLVDKISLYCLNEDIYEIYQQETLLVEKHFKPIVEELKEKFIVMGKQKEKVLIVLENPDIDFLNYLKTMVEFPDYGRIRTKEHKSIMEKIDLKEA